MVRAANELESEYSGHGRRHSWHHCNRMEHQRGEGVPAPDAGKREIFPKSIVSCLASPVHYAVLWSDQVIPEVGVDKLSNTNGQKQPRKQQRRPGNSTIFSFGHPGVLGCILH